MYTVPSITKCTFCGRCSRVATAIDDPVPPALRQNRRRGFGRPSDAHAAPSPGSKLDLRRFPPEHNESTGFVQCIPRPEARSAAPCQTAANSSDAGRYGPARERLSPARVESGRGECLYDIAHVLLPAYDGQEVRNRVRAARRDACALATPARAHFSLAHTLVGWPSAPGTLKRGISVSRQGRATSGRACRARSVHW